MMLLPEHAHDPLLTDDVLRLGEFHWYLLKAANRMRDARYSNDPAGDGRFVKWQRTDFGKEVGRDEINWWVFKKEPDLNELADRTLAGLDAAQALKRASTELRERHQSHAYEDLVRALRDLAGTHSEQIRVLRDYVAWLYGRDPLAPAILYSYRVWGDTRRGDRSHVQVAADSPAAETQATLLRLGETALGLLGSFGLYAFSRASQEVMEDMFAAEDFREVPIEDVVTRAASFALSACVTYFEQVRDSFRNIQIDIEACLEQQNLLHSDGFWRDFIQKAVSSKKTETQLWDFKDTLTMWHAAGGAKDAAAVTFCEDVASFANADGGVLIVGVTDRREIVGTGTDRDVENRLKSTSDVLAQRLHYPRPIASIHQVRLADASNVDRTCLIVASAQACEVVGVRGDRDAYTYPIRRGTGLSRVAPSEIGDPKRHLKSDNYKFLDDLLQFVRENS